MEPSATSAPLLPCILLPTPLSTSPHVSKLQAPQPHLSDPRPLPQLPAMGCRAGVRAAGSGFCSMSLGTSPPSADSVSSSVKWVSCWALWGREGLPWGVPTPRLSSGPVSGPARSTRALVTSFRPQLPCQGFLLQLRPLSFLPQLHRGSRLLPVSGHMHTHACAHILHTYTHAHTPRQKHLPGLGATTVDGARPAVSPSHSAHPLEVSACPWLQGPYTCG